MASRNSLGGIATRAKAKVKRKGIHAKTKMSKLKGSKNYTKISRG